MNEIVLSGFLTADPEIKKTPKDISYINCQIGVGREFKTNGQYVTDFIRLKIYGKDADYIDKYAYKGCFIETNGKLYNEKYQTKDGQNRIITYVNVEHIKVVNIVSKKERANEEEEEIEPAIKEAETPSDVAIAGDDLPF